MSRRVSGSCGDAIHRQAGEETAGLDRWVRIVEKLAVYRQFGAEDVIDLYHVFPEVEDISEGGYVGERTGGSRSVGKREFGEEVFDISRGNRIYRGCWDAGAVRGASARRTVAVGPLGANYVVELSICHP